MVTIVCLKCVPFYFDCYKMALT